MLGGLSHNRENLLGFCNSIQVELQNPQNPQPDYKRHVFNMVFQAMNLIEAYANDPNESLKDRIEVYGKLSETLRDFSEKIQGNHPEQAECTPLVHQVLEVATVSKQLNQELYNRRWAAVSEKINQHFQEEWGSPAQIFREVIFQLDGGFPFKSEDLDGDILSFQTKLALENLKAFFLTIEETLSPQEKAGMQELIKDLETLNHLTFQFDTLDFAMLPADQLHPCLSDVAADVQRRIQSLNPGQELAVPGGFPILDNGPTGHSYLYVIKRQDDRNGLPNYSIIIVDSAQGSENHDYNFALTDLSEQQVANRDFLYDLAKIYAVPDPAFSMQRVFQSFLTHLDRDMMERGPLREFTGGNGSCTFDCIQFWLKDRMDPARYAAFKEFFKNSSVEKLRELQADYVTDENTKEKVDDLKALFQGTTEVGGGIILESIFLILGHEQS